MALETRILLVAGNGPSLAEQLLEDEPFLALFAAVTAAAIAENWRCSICQHPVEPGQGAHQRLEAHLVSHMRPDVAAKYPKGGA